MMQMSADDHSWLSNWTVGVRVWMERAGQAVVGPGRLELLEWIDRAHSISAAARQMGISYRHAWMLVQSINEAAGEPMVVAATGGTRGGGARLTDHGRTAVALFRDLQRHVQQAAATALPRLLPDMPSPACVHVAASVSLEEVLDQLLTDFALRQPAVRVRVVFGAADELIDQVLGGAVIDLFLTADPDKLERLGKLKLLERSQPTFLAENTLAALGPAASKLNIRRASDLLADEVGRIALASADVPLGRYTRTYLEGLGLYEALAARAVTVENSRAVVAAVQAGQADVGLVYSSATATAGGCKLLFRVRRPEPPIRYAGAVVHRGQQPEAARKLLEFLASPPAQRRFRRCGFLPVK
jgi:molybdate transport system substrate-binding protein